MTVKKTSRSLLGLCLFAVASALAVVPREAIINAGNNKFDLNFAGEYLALAQWWLLICTTCSVVFRLTDRRLTADRRLCDTSLVGCSVAISATLLGILGMVAKIALLGALTKSEVGRITWTTFIEQFLLSLGPMTGIAVASAVIVTSVTRRNCSFAGDTSLFGRLCCVAWVLLGACIGWVT
jgi:hypothetical protein